MTLHIVSKSPHSANALTDCLASFTDGDALLLVEDGTYALSGSWLEKIPANPIYCLKADAKARGLQIPEGVEAVDDTGWVELCTHHNPIVSWYK